MFVDIGRLVLLVLTTYSPGANKTHLGTKVLGGVYLWVLPTKCGRLPFANGSLPFAYGSLFHMQMGAGFFYPG
jgi:hypothetical protein